MENPRLKVVDKYTVISGDINIVTVDHDDEIFDFSGAIASYTATISSGNNFQSVTKTFRNSSNFIQGVQPSGGVTLNGQTTSAGRVNLNPGDILVIKSTPTSNTWIIFDLFSLNIPRYITNTSTTAPNKSGLNSLYGSYKANSIIRYPNITTGAIKYIKVDDTITSDWDIQNITLLS